MLEDVLTVKCTTFERVSGLITFEGHGFSSNPVLVNDHNLYTVTLNYIQYFK